MTMYVSIDSIDVKVVEDWKESIIGAASKDGANLRTLMPFGGSRRALYDEVVSMVRDRPTERRSIEYYRLMVRFMQGFEFEHS